MDYNEWPEARGGRYYGDGGDDYDEIAIWWRRKEQRQQRETDIKRLVQVGSALFAGGVILAAARDILKNGDINAA
jgi:hypothetical protein